MTLGPRKSRAQRLAQHFERPAHVVGVRPPDPLDTDAFYRVDDRVVALAMHVRRARGRNVLATGRGGVAVVDDHGQVVVLVEHRIADAARQPVVPEAAVTHDGDRTFAALACRTPTRLRPPGRSP